MEDYQKARIEFFEKHIKEMSIFVSFVKERYPKVYEDAVTTGGCNVLVADTAHKIDTKY
jgi:hypothetical protein